MMLNEGYVPKTAFTTEDAEDTEVIVVSSWRKGDHGFAHLRKVTLD